MTITDYLQLPIADRKQIVTEPVGIKDQFWLERLKTAFKFSNPLAVSLHKTLVDEYWTLKKS
ncbi:hypothetical protein JOE44_001982 [Chryseobacterium sp. PvR013]|uniref:hypothetical protein n=1 Tax=Chryseobacterium sp. PvR013 TaxID=2806595 RepID=UPI001AEAB8E2|nr:hypothetical protein [Chryseobacterium sp. PvR013]MBP1165098.1 hypothetical protein [Chryseobacterium sp. PvR013]